MEKFQRDLENALKKFEAAKDEIHPENYILLKERLRELKSIGRKPCTITNNINTLLLFARYCEQKQLLFTELTFDDLENFWDTIHTSDVTKNFHKKLVKTLLKDINHEAVKKLRIPNTKNKVTRDMLLSDEEVYKLIDAASTARDKALIATLYDSGARIGEVLSTIIADATFDNYGCKLWLREGKTGPRHARLVFASSYMRQWLEVHPCKNDQNASLFCSFREPHHVMSCTGLYDMIKTTREKAGVKKRTNPHIYRHTKATTLAKKLKSEQKIKNILGWQPDSTMLARYVKLSGDDIDAAIFEVEGIKEVKEPEQPKFYRCKRCGEQNAVTLKECWKCGYCETDTTPEDIDQLKQTIAQMQTQMQMIQDMFATKTFTTGNTDTWEIDGNGSKKSIS